MKILFLFLCLVSSLGAQDRKDFENKSVAVWTDLSQKEQAIASYQGYCFVVNYANLKTPIINVMYIEFSKNKSKGDTRVLPLLTLVPVKNDAEQSLFDAKLKDFDNFKPLKITLKNSETDHHNFHAERGNENEQAEIFNFEISDSNSKMRMESWREKDNGFTMGEAVFGADGNILVRKFFRSVEFRISHMPSANFGEPQVVNFGAIDPNFLGKLDLTKKDDLIAVVRRFVRGID